MSDDGSQTYSFTVTPEANTEGTITLAIAGGAFVDAGGNTNTDTSSIDVGYDFISPTLAVTIGADADEGTTLDLNDENLTATFTFSEEIDPDSFDFAEDLVMWVLGSHYLR